MLLMVSDAILRRSKRKKFSKSSIFPKEAEVIPNGKRISCLPLARSPQLTPHHQWKCRDSGASGDLPRRLKEALLLLHIIVSDFMSKFWPWYKLMPTTLVILIKGRRCNRPRFLMLSWPLAGCMTNSGPLHGP